LILLYHHVAPAERVPSREAADEGWQFRHSPEGFRRQLGELRRRGWEFVPLQQLLERIRRSGGEPARAAAITFDDGWRDQYEHALPILVGEGVPATFFLTTDHLRGRSTDRRKMSWAQVRELVAAGMSVGGHSRTHADLTRLDEARAREEIAGCRADLEDGLGRAVSTFAYPGGAFNRRVVDWTREAGFEAACSVLSPARNDASSLYWLFRDVISEGMDTPGDRYRLSPWARRLLAWRVHRRLRLQLRRA
jgi:peptidoglycan/xylan/chitin deacetylase (PgdA/CDA1 family)